MRNIFNDVIYPDFTKRPTRKPSLKIHTLEPYKATDVDGYKVLMLPVKQTSSLPKMELLPNSFRQPWYP